MQFTCKAIQNLYSDSPLWGKISVFKYWFLDYSSGRNTINSSSSGSEKAHRASFRHEERGVGPLWPVERLRLDVPWNCRAGSESERKLRLDDQVTCPELPREVLNLWEFCPSNTQSSLPGRGPRFPGLPVPDQPPGHLHLNGAWGTPVVTEHLPEWKRLKVTSWNHGNPKHKLFKLACQILSFPVCQFSVLVETVDTSI